MKTSFKEFLLSNGEERTGAKEGSGVKIFFLFFFYGRNDSTYVNEMISREQKSTVIGVS